MLKEIVDPAGATYDIRKVWDGYWVTCVLARLPLPLAACLHTVRPSRAHSYEYARKNGLLGVLCTTIEVPLFVLFIPSSAFFLVFACWRRHRGETVPVAGDEHLAASPGEKSFGSLPVCTLATFAEQPSEVVWVLVVSGNACSLSGRGVWFIGRSFISLFIVSVAFYCKELRVKVEDGPKDRTQPCYHSGPPMIRSMRASQASTHTIYFLQ